MGFRFRKSVKICKGVRINISKSGTSLSVGGAGHSVNFSSKGTKSTIGIPGTGLSYSTYTGTKSTYKNSGSSVKSMAPSLSITGSFRVNMNDKGQISIFDDAGNQITDQSVLRKIRATTQFKVLKENLESQRQEKMTELFENSQSENQKFLNIHTFSPIIKTKDQVLNAINQLKAERYQREIYSIAPPNEDEITKQLQEEADRIVKANIFTVKKKRKQYVVDNLHSRMQDAQNTWEAEKRTFEEEEDLKEKVINERYEKQFAEHMELLRRIVDGEEALVVDAIDKWIAECTLPVEININYEYSQAEGIVLLDVDLPEIEDLPATEVVRLANGNIKEHKKTQKETNAQYATLVFGLAVFIVSNIFNITPSIQSVLISGYTQRRDKKGDIQDTYIYSIKFLRRMFEHVGNWQVNPEEFCLQAENRCNQTTTGLFRPIVPFDSF